MAENEVQLKIKVTSEGSEQIDDTSKKVDNLDKKSKKGNTTFVDLSKSLLQSNNVTGALGKSVVSLASKLGVMGVAGAIGIKTFQGLKQFTIESIKEADKYNTTLSSLTSAVNTYGSTTYSVADIESRATKISDTYKIAKSKLAEMLEDGIKKTNDLDTAESLLIDSIELEKSGVIDLESAYQTLLDAYDGSLIVLDELEKTMPAGMQAVNKEIDKLKTGKDETIGYINDVNDRWNKLGDDIKTSWGDEWLLQIAKWKDTILIIVDKVGGLLDGIKNIKEKYVDPMIDKIKEWWDSLKMPEWLKSALDLIGTFLGNTTIGTQIKAGYDLIGGDTSLANIEKTLFGGGLVNAMDDLASWLGVKGMANGGVVTSGGIVNVGENGPEQLILPTGAEVIPNGGSNGVNITLNVSGSVWTTRQLANELSSLFYEQMTLRGVH